jgi:mannose/fructose/N-acetylgalactosamine-specific phosphotransferase system component IIC
MTLKGWRVVAFYGLHLVYFPLLIGLLWGFTLLHDALVWEMPRWLNAVLTLALAGGLYVGLGYAVARRLNQLEGR